MHIESSTSMTRLCIIKYLRTTGDRMKPLNKWNYKDITEFQKKFKDAIKKKYKIFRFNNHEYSVNYAQNILNAYQYNINLKK